LLTRAARGQHPATATAASQSAVPTSPPIPQDVANSPADATYGLLPGEDPDNHLVKPFLKHIVSDQEQFWTYPAHLQFQDIKWIAPVAGITASLIASDSWISHQIPNKPSQLTRSLHISDYSVYSMIGIGGGSYLLGEITHNDHLSETGLLAGEAAIDSTGVAYLLKEVTQRERPNAGNGDGQFFTGGQSFPSEHSAIAWSIASVWAHEYPGTLSQILAYGLASAVTATRVTSQQHFSSDVFIGSALGWYFGRQVYRSHHDESLGGAAWGDLFPKQSDHAEKVRNPKNMGSPYVPLDSWIYASLERLQALGYIHTAYLGMRPWTRLECARVLEEAADQIGNEGLPDNNQAGKIYVALQSEFAPESGRLDGAENLAAGVDSVYTRGTEISGRPVTDGYHFGQTITNDYGRPYSQGFNNITGFTSEAVAGPLAISVQGEYQHAPAIPSDSAPTLAAISAADFVPPLANGMGQTNTFQLLQSEASVTFGDVKFSFGKQSEWMGPSESGAFLMSDNAAPFLTFKIDTTTPQRIPLLSYFLGPARSEFFIGQLSGQHWEFCIVATCPTANPAFPGVVGPSISPQPFIHGEKISFKPTPNFEFGMGFTAMFGGPGLPVTLGNFFRTYYIHSTTAANNPGKRTSSADFTYRIPHLRNWLSFYMDSMVVDEISPLGSTRANVNPGIYMPQFPGITKLELRAEGINESTTNEFTPGFVYTDVRRFRDGYTNDGFLLGSWIGRAGRGGQGWLTYNFSAHDTLQLGYRLQEVSPKFIGGGRLVDYSARTAFNIGPRVGVLGTVQYEQWQFPDLVPGRHSDVTTSLQFTFHKPWQVQK